MKKILSGLIISNCIFSLLFTVHASAKEYTGSVSNDQITWSYNDETDTLTLTGDGDSVLTEIGIDPLWNPISTIEVQGIAQINCKLTADTIILGKEVKDFITPTLELDGVPYANICYIVDPDNPYYTCYDDALYTKDLTELIHVPPLKTEIDFPDTLEKIDSYAFLFTVLDEIIVPWGVTTIEDYGVEFLSPRAERNEYMYVILPDTLKSIGESDRYTMCRFAYSGNNSAISTSRLYPMLSDQALQICQEVIKLYGKSSLYDFYGITPNSFKTFGSKTYYFDADRKMVTGTQTINGKTYTFDQNGVLQEESDTISASAGVVYQDGKAYIYDEDGNMLRSGWYQADGNWYYLNDYGAGVVSCWRLKDGKYVYLGADGKMQTNCWVEDYSDWYYLKADGTRYESAWAKIGGSWYWFGGSGKMMSNGWLKLDGKWYYFRSGGQMAAGWIQDGGKWYYLTGSGAMAANKWIKSGSYWYYLGSNGALLTNTTTPDGYHVDSEGRWV